MMVAGRRTRLPAFDMWSVALCVVFLAALALRLYGLDWDDGADLHPDELFIAKIVLIDRIHLEWPPDLELLLDPARSGLNPRSADPATGQFREFAYGALPLWITDAVAWVLSRLTNDPWNDPDHAYLVGRALSALLSALTILPTAALGALLGGRAVGLLAALFAALAPMSVQLAHFFTTDSWLTFFVAICLYACVVAARYGSMRSFAAAGAAFGLAMACKGSVFTLAAPIAIAVASDALRRMELTSPPAAVRAATRRAAGTAVATVGAFLIFEPYALLRPDVYLQSLKTQADIVSGTFDVPFTRVYSGTTPIAYQVEQLVRWGFGPVAGLLALAGIVLLAALALRRGSVPALILTTWVGAYGAVMAISQVKFLRYLEPLAPVLAIGAALALVRLRDMAQAARPNPVTRALPAMLLLVSTTWTAAFLSVYAHENSRLAATQWIYATAPPGSIMTAEYWDDALPRSLGFGLSPATFGYGSIMLDLYRDLPPPEASDAIYAGISDADYIIQSSHRVESAIHAEPWRYPVQGRFFDQLERGALGFTPVVSIVRAPTIGGLTIDDRDADESFLNYDHPGVAIYARAQPLARADYDAVMSWALQRPWYPQREPPRPPLLLDGPVGENPSVADARWSAGLTQNTLAAVLVWILLLLVLLAIGRPIARIVFPAFPDAGWGVARTLALVIAAYPVWLGASLELFRFRAIAVLASLAACGLGLWRLRVWFDRAHGRRRSPTPGRAWLHAEAAFWLVFALFLVFRLINPDGWHPIWGGEKAMEFAQINAIGRSAYFPPYDPWYADGYVNYYYYGFYLVTFLLKATGIPAEVGFNLALPTMMGLLASGGFSVAAALSRGLTRSPRLAVAGGWLGAAALSVLGNLSAMRALIAANANTFDPFIHWTWNGSRAIDNVITEFPFFSGLYADLHAHVIALPLTVAVIALCLVTATSRVIPVDNATATDFSWLPIITRLVLLALLLGSLSATNAWDVPVYVALTVTSIVTATASIATLRKRIALCVAGSVVTVAGGWLLFLPFHRHFVALFSALALVRDPTDLLQFLSHLGGLLTICAVGLTVLLLPRASRPASSFWPLFVIAAGVLGIALLAQDLSPPLSTAAIALVIAALAAPPLTAAWLRLASDRVVPPRVARGQRALLLVAPVAAAGSVVAGREVFALLVALGIAAAVAWLCLPRPAERFAALLAAAGFFTAAGVEIVVVADDLIQTAAYRMNTVFKFYNQVWVLLALSAAAMIALMLRDARRGTALHVAPASGARAVWSRPGLALSALFLLAMLAYPVLATGPRLAQRFTPGTQPGTLNALGWMAEGTVPTLGPGGWEEIAFAGDLAAITWLNANVTGSPVIAEASIGPYRCNGSRIANATGLPTIIGWERHEQQQRYPASLPARVTDVRTLYTSPDVDQKTSILRRYNVAYVVVGDLERRYPRADNDCTSTGNAAGIAAFAEMTGTTLDVAFSSGATTIYRVLPVAAA